MATKKKQQTGMTLVLDGKVFLVDRQPGKKAVKTEIDGEVVLKLVLMAINKGTDLLLEEQDHADQVAAWMKDLP